MRMKRVKAALTGVFLVAMATTGISAAAYGSPAAQRGSSASNPISVLYSYNYVFDSDAQANKWWASLAKQWAKAHPSVKLTLLGTGGTDIDEMNKAAVLFRSPSATPCVIQLPTTYVGQFAGSGYLAPLNSYVKGSSFWNGMPKSVQEMSTIDGQVDAVNAGNNDSGIVYNKVFLKKAGIKLPWYPKTWQDILNVAKAVKKANPKVYALWLGAGVGAGATQRPPGNRQPNRRIDEPSHVRHQDWQVGCQQPWSAGDIPVLQDAHGAGQADGRPWVTIFSRDLLTPAQAKNLTFEAQASNVSFASSDFQGRTLQSLIDAVLAIDEQLGVDGVDHAST